MTDEKERLQRYELKFNGGQVQFFTTDDGQWVQYADVDKLIVTLSGAYGMVQSQLALRNERVQELEREVARLTKALIDSELNPMPPRPLFPPST